MIRHDLNGVAVAQQKRLGSGALCHQPAWIIVVLSPSGPGTEFALNPVVSLRPTSALLATAALWLSGCNGNITLEVDGADPDGRAPNATSSNNPDAPSSFEAPNAPPPEGCKGDECLEFDPVPEPELRAVRLSHEQWVNSIEDLFSISNASSLAANFEPDALTGNFDTDTTSRRVSALLWSQYQVAAENVAAAATQNASSLSAWLPAGLPTEANARIDSFIEKVGRRIFRRPLEAEETSRLRSVFDAGRSFFPELDAFSAGARLFLEATLQAPQFLYRTERTTELQEGLYKLTGYEIAARLSFSLLDTTPSDQLLDDAASGLLDDEAGVQQTVRNMLASESGHAVLKRFFEQHLELHRLDDIPKDSNFFPAWNDSVATAAGNEVRSFIENLIREGATLDQLLLSRSGFPNDALAGIYGLGGAGFDSRTETELPANRPGLLTRVGFLAANGTLRDPDPIHRGVFVNRHLLCRTINPPDSIPDNLSPTGTTNRQRIDSITGAGTCGAGCHATILNPPGFALEHFDAVGAYRETDNGETVDASGMYTFEDGQSITFDGAESLSSELAASKAFHVCQADQLVEYFAGQRPNAGLAPLVQKTGTSSLTEQSTLVDVVVAIMSSRALRYRSAEYYEEGQ